jgi:hypothetical protein
MRPCPSYATQRDVEVSLGRYSSLLVVNLLLPGMTCQPIFAVPKPGSSKFRLINDHSAGENSLNSLIPSEGGFVKLDTLRDLGANIRAQIALHGGERSLAISSSQTCRKRIGVCPCIPDGR